MTREEIRKHLGKRVTLKLAPGAPGAPGLTGRIEGVLDAADGMVVTVVPDGAPQGTTRTIHYHYIQAIAPAP
jgi:hypothetical protein